ncbi:DUF116 domain-containing protein [uncultured Clostridium sp.]|uniref:DUF116 domain-containing protein n=1 Tax=uncultured Clostridium sp. TaxID=59620 RepID=UPI0028E2B258|nr:DUF116 domain-containing protein [uncultured Clostridium sp.]
MEIITYSLCANDATSGEYYNRIDCFTNEVIDKINETTYEIVENYRNYIIEKGLEIPMEKTVYGFELLMTGALWRVYIKKALSLNKYAGKILSKLVFSREKNGNTKIIVDLLRGVLGNKFLLKENKKSNDADNEIDKFMRFTDWLKASGEFNQEAKRIEIWGGFLNSQSKEESINIISKAKEIGKWFEIRSVQVIGCYTQNVENFIKENQGKLKWKENNIFCSRERVEYHLNMVGAEIMNRSFREGFLKTKEKRVLLPICMRYKSKENCKALKTENGYLCTGCSAECRVNSLTALGKKNDFKVYIIPHASSAFTKGEMKEGEVGIVGIACVLNLISGGFKAKEIGFEPQCVLLNYCGCKKHWHKNGIVTDIYLKRLINILGLDLNEIMNMK